MVLRTAVFLGTAMIAQSISSGLAGGIARALSFCLPATAKKFYFWYRTQSLRHPNWVAPIRWIKANALLTRSRA